MIGRPAWQRWLATLCVALSVVFAGNAAASVLDRLQHGAQLEHDHGLHVEFSADDGHHDHGPAAHGHGDQGDERQSGDHPAGLGHHHHTDAPSGALSNASGATPTLQVADAGLSLAASLSARGIRPGGLERPPRTPGMSD